MNVDTRHPTLVSDEGRREWRWEAPSTCQLKGENGQGHLTMKVMYPDSVKYRENNLIINQLAKKHKNTVRNVLA